VTETLKNHSTLQLVVKEEGLSCMGTSHPHSSYPQYGKNVIKEGYMSVNTVLHMLRS